MKKRYFLVSFNIINNQGKIIFGSINFEHLGFFSRTFLLSEINEIENLANIEDHQIVIINIYEFDDQYDYEEYKK